MAGENGSEVKTNRVTPIIYLGITFTPSYYKHSNSLLHSVGKNSLALGQNLPGIMGFYFYFYFFWATNISRVAKSICGELVNFTWARGRCMADS
jgi:hypothetical protein